MSDQIFKTKVDLNILTDFLNKHAIKLEKYYLFNKVSYKKARMFNELQIFYDKILSNYFNCKQKYITRKKTYKNCITVVRQICKSHCIPFTSKLIYRKSTYEIEYYIGLIQTN
ncbi:hypothetical protein OAI84_00095 [bacterium]|nr:hypothetical protein [bacterium]